MNKKTKKNKTKEAILRTLSYEEKRARGSRRVAEKLGVSQSYISNLLTEMADEGTIHYKEALVGKGSIFWNKEQMRNKGIIHEKETKGAKIERHIVTVLTTLKINEAMNVREIVEQMLHWKMNWDAKHVSPIMSKMYRNGIVKRSKILYKDGYYYWLEGDEREKNIKGVPRQRKSVIKANITDDRLKYANELHNINVSLRELVGKYRNNNKKLKQTIDSRNKEIKQQKDRITTLELELQNISTEQDVAKDIYESRKLLEHTFK